MSLKWLYRLSIKLGFLEFLIKAIMYLIDYKILSTYVVLKTPFGKFKYTDFTKISEIMINSDTGEIYEINFNDISVKYILGQRKWILESYENEKV